MYEQELTNLIRDTHADMEERAIALIALLQPVAMRPDFETEAERRGFRGEYRILDPYFERVVERAENEWRLTASAQKRCADIIEQRVWQNCRVWIIHGGQSEVWLKIRDHLERVLRLQCCEFNDPDALRVTTQGRVLDMAQSAQLAVAVMTGEDLTPPQQLRARQNVIHEIGLSHGILGLERVIILVERGIERFSNMDGIVYVYFERDALAPALSDLSEHITTRLKTKPT